MTRWLVTGAAGMLGHDLVHHLRQANVAVTALARADCDITDADAVRAAVAGHDIVINAAGWTDVDGAETAEDAATLVNGTAVARLARACAEHGARLLHVSTDYVFAGDRTSPYPEDAPTRPINAYGRGKLVGEQAVLAELPDERVRRAHGLALRQARSQLREHDAEPGRSATHRTGGQRPARPADLGGRAGPSAGRPGRPGAWSGRRRPGSTTPPRPARPPGMNWPGPSSPAPVWIPTGSNRRPATSSSARRPDPRRRCSAMPGGRKQVCRRWPIGARCWPRPWSGRAFWPGPGRPGSASAEPSLQAASRCRRRVGSGGVVAQDKRASASRPGSSSSGSAPSLAFLNADTSASALASAAEMRRSSSSK